MLHREANTVMHGTYSGKNGKALLGAVTQASWLAASMTADVGRHSLAQPYYIQTLNLAMSAGDRLHAANVLTQMSRLTVQPDTVPWRVQPLLRANRPRHRPPGQPRAGTGAIPGPRRRSHRSAGQLHPYP